MIKDILTANETVNPNSREIEILHKHFSQCFNKEGLFDIDKFQTIIKENVNITHEGYDLNFLGKNYAKLLASIDTTTIIKPDLEHNNKPENKDSQNIYISGDNLDGLKHLLKSYAGSIKCIYIDPPYNTGTDGFVYNDNFNFTTEELSTKLSISEEQANKILDLTKRGSASHSAWLMFMAARLQLAKDLLTDDGVIFISIDDNEQANLKLLCDNIFGEENLISSFIWKKRQMVDSRTKNGASKDHDFLLCYSRLEGGRIQGKESDKNKYSNPDKDPKGAWMSADMTGLATESQRPNLHYDLVNPQTGIVYKCPITGWRYERSRMSDLITNGEIIFPKNSDGRPRRKKYLKDVESSFTGFSSIFDTVYSTQGTRELRDLFNGQDYFDFPKPVDYIKQIVEQGIFPTNSKDIYVLDFFSGSATTAHAVLQLKQNQENLHFILVQLQEPYDLNSDAYKSGFKTIDEIGQARIIRSAQHIKESNPLFHGDLGFKHYTLVEPDDDTIDKLETFDPHRIFTDRTVLEQFGIESVLETWLVKDGYGLGAQVNKVKLDKYVTYHYKKHLYFIDTELSESDMVALIDEYSKNAEFNPENIILFGYSFTFTQTEMLRKNIAILKDSSKNLKINIDIRY